MTELLDLCQWPTLPAPYDLALHEAVAHILKRFFMTSGDGVGIIAAGSILRGVPDATSDLDLYVLHRAPFRQRLQKTFNGVPAEIFVNPPVAVERYLEEEQQERRPITAHMLATGYVVLALDPIVAALREKAAALLLTPPAPPENPIMARYMVATLYEDAMDVLERDPATGRMLLGRVVVEMLNYGFVVGGQFQPRMKDLLAVATQHDPDAGNLARRFFEIADLDEQVALAARLAERTIEVQGFFEWESEPEAVPGA